MDHLPIVPEIYRLSNQPETWAVEAIDADSDGEIYLAIFQGPEAEKVAREYAQEKFAPAED